MCSISVQAALAGVLSVIAAIGAVSAAVAVLAPQIARNARDVQAAWAQIRRHEQALNGALQKPPEGPRV